MLQCPWRRPSNGFWDLACRCGYTGTLNVSLISLNNRKLQWERCNWREYVFSGDFDAVCPLTATRYSIADLELSVMEPWRPWTATREVNNNPNPVLDLFLSFFYSNFDKLVWILAGWRLCSAVHGRSCAYFSEGSWSSSSLFPAWESTSAAQILLERNAPTLCSGLVDFYYVTP